MCMTMPWHGMGAFASMMLVHGAIRACGGWGAFGSVEVMCGGGMCMCILHASGSTPCAYEMSCMCIGLLLHRLPAVALWLQVTRCCDCHWLTKTD